MTPEQVNWLTWGAIAHRPRNAPRWDQPGTHKAITDFCGSWDLAMATEHVLAHARDPKANTPFVIKGNPPSTGPTKGARQPAKAGTDTECRRHPGEWSASCRVCSAERFTHPEDPVLDDPTFASGRALREELRARREATTPPQEES